MMNSPVARTDAGGDGTQWFLQVYTMVSVVQISGSERELISLPPFEVMPKITSCMNDFTSCMKGQSFEAST
ncbi:hypothetical protein MKW98_023093 [Papaver atlanticum]|uniref:Uncharacterized protein n=1 Tax=Papaver atlanticum TaxID=357466 RepID=A0AAD4XUA9_9MAGN|nr:hypothetical protein MKW98_023093 [Papaver atlanticum]